MVTSSSTTSSPRQTLSLLRSGGLQGCTYLDLRGCGLTELPVEVLALADTLEGLDLSGNDLIALPDSLEQLRRLHTVFASNNRFVSLPSVLGRLPALDTLGFKANRIGDVPADALAPSLRWLILTDNRITSLPHSLADCQHMQKLMLAGNRLTRLPVGMGRLQRLELIRLAANLFEVAEHALPDELLALPRLAWLAHAGNPFSARTEQCAQALTVARLIPWHELDVQAMLGQGASGHIYAARWQPDGAAARDVAVKLFKGAVTSDGLPQSEMAATLVAGSHPGLVGVLGVLHGHPQQAQGLVLPRLASHWAPLAAPPSMASCSRDVYEAGLILPATQAAAIADKAADALAHLHDRGIAHGDLYAHNLLVDGQGGALLSDFGAASFLPRLPGLPNLPEGDRHRSAALRAIDRRALQVLVDELAQHCNDPALMRASIRATLEHGS